MNKDKIYGVFGLNQFQLLWDNLEEAKEEAIRLTQKHKKEFCVMQKIICFDEDGKEVNGNN